MRRSLSFVIAGFTGVLAVYAGEGMPPRANSSEYPVHRDTQSASIALARVPAELVKRIFPPEVHKNFAVVEVAVFPLPGQIADVDAMDFGLKFDSDDVSYARAPNEIVGMWMEENAPKPPAKVDVAAETGVVHTSGNDPATGRGRGWGTYSGVAVGTGQPTPPRPLSADPRDFEANLSARALPEGPALHPVAGYLYFPLPAKRRKSTPVELQYLRDGVRVALPIPAK